MPETALPVISRGTAKSFRKRSGHVFLTEVAELPTGEFAKIRQHFFEYFAVEIRVKEDPVQVRRHDHVGVCPQSLVAVTIVKAVGDDFLNARSETKTGSHSTTLNVTK